MSERACPDCGRLILIQRGDEWCPWCRTHNRNVFELRENVKRLETALAIAEKKLADLEAVTKLFVACSKFPDTLHPKSNFFVENDELEHTVSYEREVGKHREDVCPRCKLLKILAR